MTSSFLCLYMPSTSNSNLVQESEKGELWIRSCPAARRMPKLTAGGLKQSEDGSDSDSRALCSFLPSLRWSAKRPKSAATSLLLSHCLAVWQQLVAAESLGDICHGWSGVQLKCLVCSIGASASSPCVPPQVSCMICRVGGILWYDYYSAASFKSRPGR